MYKKIELKYLTVFLYDFTNSKHHSQLCRVCWISLLQSSWILQAFQKLLQSGRLNPQDVDVEPYTVDGVSYLAKLDTPPL